MTTEFIPGYLGTITINSGDLTAVLGITSVNKQRNILRRPTMGRKAPAKGPGTSEVSFTANGYLTKADAAAIMALWESDTSVQVTVQYGDAGTPTDGGQSDGLFAFSQVQVTQDPEGDTMVDLAAESDGATAYTPPAP